MRSPTTRSPLSARRLRSRAPPHAGDLGIWSSTCSDFCAQASETRTPLTRELLLAAGQLVNQLGSPLLFPPLDEELNASCQTPRVPSVKGDKREVLR